MDDTQEESLFEAPPIAEQERMVEAILFAAAEPVSVREMAGRMPHGCDPLQAVENIQKRYEGRGVAVVKIQGSWAIRTAPDLGRSTVVNSLRPCRVPEAFKCLHNSRRELSGYQR